MTAITKKLVIQIIVEFIKLGKDEIKKEDTQNVLYNISCLDCNSKYVGQTKCKLKLRVKK